MPGSAPPAALPPAAGSVAARAALALALLLGYFVLVAAVLGSLAWLTISAFTTGTSGVISGKLAIVTGIVAVAIGRAVFAVERRGADDTEGVPVTRDEQPQLWALIDDVSRELGVAAPDDLRLVDDVNAFVHQDSRLLGLVGGPRHMGIGVALLQVLTVDELRGVIAHELGHYAGGDTRLSALVYRAGATVERTVLHLGPGSIIGRLFSLYARLYARVSLAVRRRQELRADEGSARIVGAAVHESALREAQAAAAVWSFFGDRYVVPVWQAGMAPEDLYVGYRALYDDPEREEQIDEVRQGDDGPAHPYDSHPPLSARIAHVRRLPDRAAPGDERGARSLLHDAAAVERRVTGTVNARVLGGRPSATYAFADTLDSTPYTAGLADEVGVLSRATAAVDGLGAPAGLDRTLAVLECGRDAQLVTALTGDRRELGDQARWEDLRSVVVGPFAGAAAHGLVASGRAAWRASWSRPVHLVDPRGRELDLAGRLDDALVTDGVEALRAVLVDAGVPLDESAPLPPIDETDGIDEEVVVAVWPELRRRRRRFDALVTRDLLVVVPQRRTLSTGVRRALVAQWGVARASVRSTAVDRVQALLDVPLDELRRRPRVLTVRWDDLQSVRLSSGITTAWVLRLPGQDKPLDLLKAEDETLVPSPQDTAALLSRLVGDRLDTRLS